jgi:hypothetical protein
MLTGTRNFILYLNDSAWNTEISSHTDPSYRILNYVIIIR